MRLKNFIQQQCRLRAQKHAENIAPSLSPHTDKDVEALNVDSEESKHIQNGNVHENIHCKKAREEPVKTQIKHKKCCDKTAKFKVLVNGDEVSVLSPTVLDKLLFRWKGPAVVTER